MNWTKSLEVLFNIGNFNSKGLLDLMGKLPLEVSWGIN